MNKRIWLAAAAVASASLGSATENSMKSQQIAPARDGDTAIHEELCAARGKGTVEAYDLFIARHPAHPLAEVAKKERMQLSSRGSSSR